MLGKIHPAPASVSSPAPTPYRTSFVIRLALCPKIAGMTQARSGHAGPFRLIRHGSASETSVRILWIDRQLEQGQGGVPESPCADLVYRENLQVAE
jgi:hypothetical protein